MARAWYVVPAALADATLVDARAKGTAGCGGYTTVPGSSGLALFDLDWFDWRAREAFEAQGGVIALGDPWDPVPAAAVEVLEALRASAASARLDNKTVASAVTSADTVAVALRKALPHTGTLALR